MPSDFAQPLVLIIDGYDECISQSAPVNLAQQLGLPVHSPIKLVITCRPEIVPTNELHHHFASSGQPLQICYFLPFSMGQLFQYMTDQLLWSKEIYQTYQTELTKNTALRAVLRNPFVLSLCVESWSVISKKEVNRLDRWQIYESFVEHILATQSNLLSTTVKKQLCGDEPSLLASFNRVAAEVAFKVFQSKSLTLKEETALKLMTSDWLTLEQSVAAESRRRFKLREKALVTKKAQSQEIRRTLLSEADYVAIQVWRSQQFQQHLPLKHKAFGYEFSHKSFFEYFTARRLALVNQSSDPKAEGLVLFNTRSLQEEPEVLAFWREAWQSHVLTSVIEPWFELIAQSRQDDKIIQAASNAATLLARARVSFSGRDLHAIHIPGADLSGAILYNSNLSHADLTDVNLRQAILEESTLSQAVLRNIQFDEQPFFRGESDDPFQCLCFDQKGELLAVGSARGWIHIWDVKSGDKLRTIKATEGSEASPGYWIGSWVKSVCLALTVNCLRREADLQEVVIQLSGYGMFTPVLCEIDLPPIKKWLMVYILVRMETFWLLVVMIIPFKSLIYPMAIQMCYKDIPIA